MARGCRLCGTSDLVRSGVHFVVSDAHTGEYLAAYDICAQCMDKRSPLIIPAEVRRPGVMQLRISYAGFGGYQGPPPPARVRGGDE